MRRSLGATAALAVAACLVLAGCGRGSDTDTATGPGEVDPGLAARIADVGIPLYLPELRGSRAGATLVDGVRQGDPAVRTEFAGLQDSVMGDDTWTLAQKPTSPRVGAGVGSGRALCRALRWEDADYGCTGGRDHAVVDYEGDTTVALVRGPTTLYVNIETESDPGLVGETVAALRDAAEVSPEDLSRPRPRG